MRKLIQLTVFTQVLVWTLAATTLVTGIFPPEGRAMLVPSTATATEQGTGFDRTADLQKVQSVLESKVVRQRLEDYGLTAEEINARLTQLSDAQVHQLASQIDALIPAGDGGLGIVIALLVIAILVVILVYLMGNRVAIVKQ